MKTVCGICNQENDALEEGICSDCWEIENERQASVHEKWMEGFFGVED